MYFELKMDLGNDAFYGDACENEIVRILQVLRERMMVGDSAAGASYVLIDLNGNSVGSARFSEPEEAKVLRTNLKGKA